MVLDPDTSPAFAKSCGSSCIILIAVVNSAELATHFKIQASQDFQELVDNVKIEA